VFTSFKSLVIELILEGVIVSPLHKTCVMKRWRNLFLLAIPLLIFLLILFDRWWLGQKKHFENRVARSDSSSLIRWRAPDLSSLPSNKDKEMILYGRELIANTAYYFGPKGKIARTSNGMNCQNCHIDAGSLPYGNCLSAVASIYPVFRPRSGIVESIEYRINDCFQRSLNGKKIDSTSKEMRAMVAYLKWLGKDVPKGVKPKGANTEELPYLTRPADPIKGKLIFESKCVTCHQKNGEGLLKEDSTGYVYPPVWGSNSYNSSAGFYRLSRAAGFIKNNMPFGSSYQKPQLTNEEAWDLAAFINSQPRPSRTFAHDWPDINLKAIDHPFGPYSDTFSEQQHKYGPFRPIVKARESRKRK
jgi:thiosulfate dehydrogenase